MSRIAWIYVIGVVSAAGVLGAAALATRPQTVPPLWLFLSLTAVATLLRTARVLGPNHSAYEGSTIALFAGLLLLPFWLFIALVIISHGVEWAWVRLRSPSTSHLRAWYIQPFNMAKCIVGGGAAWAVMAILPLPPQKPAPLSTVPAVVLITFAYVAVNQLVLGLVLSLARGVSFRQAGILRDALLIEAPLAGTGFVAAELMQGGPVLPLFVLAPIFLIYQAFMLPKIQDEAMHSLQRINRELNEANRSIRQLNDELFLTLAKVFDARDPYVGGHASHVAGYAVAIATEMGLPAEQIEVIRQSGYLHDIGKLAIPEVIVHKPASLTDAEYAFVKSHSDVGADFLATSRSLRHLAPFIRHHHERWDGSGYPAGLAGQAIPLEARILSVCDAVEAMASDRPYHRALSQQDIVDEIRRGAGTQFDPQVAEAFIHVAQRRGEGFVVNSARTVAEQYVGRLSATEGAVAMLFASLYGATPSFPLDIPADCQGSSPE